MNIDKIDQKSVERIARLANLTINKNKMSQFVQEFKQILDFLNKLNEPGVPKSSIKFDKEKSFNFLREDEIEDSLPISEVFFNSNNRQNKFFAVPKMIKNNQKKKK